MKEVIVKKTLGLTVSLLLCLSSHTLLADETEASWMGLDFSQPKYVGVGFARNDVALLQGEKIQGDITTRISAEDSDSAWMFFVGMHRSEKLDIEVRFQNLGAYTEEVRIIDAAQHIQTNINTDLGYQSLNLLLRPKYALGKYFQIQGEAGLSYAMLDRSANVTVLGNKTESELAQFKVDAEADLKGSSDSELSLTYGLSLLFQRKESYAWRWAMDRHQLGSEDFSSLSVSLLWNFDR